jgi:hypothetical protein
MMVESIRDSVLKQAVDAGLSETRRNCVKSKAFDSVHEGYAVILEGLDKLCEEVKQRVPSKSRLRSEARQVAVMAIRFAAEGALLKCFFFLLSSLAGAQTITTRVLTPGAPIGISLSPGLTTTLLFPSAPSGTFGLGLVNNQNQIANGSVHIEHPDGSPILVLHALNESACVIMTVLLEGQLYLFDLRSAPNPDVAVTLVKADATAPRAIEVTPEEVRAARLKYDPELLVGYLRMAHNAVLMRKLYPDLYQDYKVRAADYTSNSGIVKTTVTQIHRFSKEDAIVLEGSVQNETDHPIRFDGRAATVLVANETHPVKLLDCLRPIPPGATVPIDVVIQGDIDGGRANLSIDNEMRIILPPIPGEGTVWNVKNGRLPGEKFKVTPPGAKPVPLTENGTPKKEGP